MKKIAVTLLFALVMATIAMAQVPYGRTDCVTIFPDYRPAKIVMASGNVLKVKEANVFLKNSSLMYKDRFGKDMEANMSLVKGVSFADREFMVFNRQLAELIHTCGNNRLIRVLTIDQDALKGEILNQSNITSVSGLISGDVLGITRDVVHEDQLRFPVIAQYYYVIDGKEMKCHEREVSHKLSKAKRETYKIATARGAFNWANEDDLKSLLDELSN